MIDSALLDRLEEHPEDVFYDTTRLDWSDDGDVYISSDGDLSDALGLSKDDVLIDINGHAFNGMLDTFGLYYRLSKADLLLLTLERGGKQRSITYVIYP